jgi:hypothetical protein
MKNISEIAYKINATAIAGAHEFSRIQEIRAHELNIKPRVSKPFADFSIKDGYAFHAGGRKELQYNIGEEVLNEKTVFRFGMAFSLYQDKTLHDSKAEFRPLKDRFNKFLRTNPDYFDGLVMWYHREHELEEVFDKVMLIDSKLFQTEHFIFFGKYFSKGISQINTKDIDEIIKLFDYLFPLYKFVQFGIEPKEKRVSRICWNDRKWLFPSGMIGKSKDPDTHEAKHGYGHEEWLFDTGKSIDGYHYGFLEPIGKQHQAFENRSYDVSLYTINSKTKQRFWVGEIKDLYVIDKATSEKIKKEYISRGWYTEMEEQIAQSGASTKGFSNWKGIDLFNVRFLPSNLKVNSPLVELPRTHPIVSLSRYAFAFYKDSFDLTDSLEEGNDILLPTGSRGAAGGSGKVKRKKYKRSEAEIEVAYLHEAISVNLTTELKKEYGAKNVVREYKMSNGTKLDIVVWHKGETYIYEIKTYPSVKSSIREAIGQLMEYGFWPNQKRAKKLIVITQPSLNFSQAEKYFQHLRNSYGLPLHYQSFDFESKALSKLV